MVEESFLQMFDDISFKCSHLVQPFTKERKIMVLPFLITLAEGLISLGRKNATVKRKSAVSLGRPIIKKRKRKHAEDAKDFL